MKRVALRAGISLSAGILLVVTSGAQRVFVRMQDIAANPAFASLPSEITKTIQESRYASARQMIALGKSAEAEQTLLKFAENDARLAPYMSMTVAELRLQRGDTNAALEALALPASLRNRAIGERALRSMARILRDSKSLDAAIGRYTELADRLSGDERRKVLIEIARCRNEAGMTEEALRNLDAVIRMPGSPQVAASAIDEILRIAPNGNASALRFAGIYYNAGEYAKAADQFARSGSSDPGVILKLARSHERADHFRDAVNAYKRLLKSAPDKSDLVARYRIGLCYQRMGQDREGEKFLQQVLVLSPRGSFADDCLYRLASLRDKKEKRAEALAYYGRLLAQFPRSSWADEAAWKIGLAYLEDGRTEEAADAFARALKRYPRSDYASAMGYWRGRILEKSNRREEAVLQYAAVLRSSQEVYYRARSSAAFQRLGGRYSMADLDAAIRRADDGQILEALADIRGIRDASAKDVSERAHAAARSVMARIGLWKDLSRFSTTLFDTAALFFDAGDKHSVVAGEISALLELGDYEDAAAEILSLRIDAGRRPEQRLAMIRILVEGGEYRRAMRDVEALIRSMGGPHDAAAMPELAAQLLYPRHYADVARAEAAKYGLDYRLVLAVIREESRFQTDVSSWAGAQGLMQIMPATGQRIARDLSIENYRREMLLDPRWNISMGTFYLSQLLASYQGRNFLALSGYNAGPGNTGRWLRENPDAEEDFFVEKIAFKETRNYVKRVLGTYWTYRQLDGEPLAQEPFKSL